MMLCVLVFAMIALTARGQSTTMMTPQKCCIGHQFTTTLGRIGGTVTHGAGVPLEGYEFVVYDYDAKMISVMSINKDMLTGTYSNTSIIENYSTNKRYVLSEGHCFFQDLTLPMREPCIPANSKFLARVMFGSGTSAMEADVWEFTTGNDVVTKLLVSTDNCTPIVDASYGTINGAKTVQTLFFTDFKTGIADRSSFTIPQNCQPLTSGSPVGRRQVPF